MNITGDMSDAVQFQCLSACVRDTLISKFSSNTRHHTRDPLLAQYCSHLVARKDIDVQQSQVFQFVPDHPNPTTFTYTWNAYPESSPVQQIAAVLLLWHRASHFPLNFTPVIGLQEATQPFLQRLNDHTHLIHDALRLLHGTNPHVDQSSLATLFETLGVTGISRCLGMRYTVATHPDIVPPPYDVLLSEFRKLVPRARPGVRLTVGARALSKHCGRRGTGWISSWWGLEADVMFGSEETKNSRAEIVLFRILSQCVWLNVHTIVGEEEVLELRVHEGYGARWSALNHAFRGFLEIHAPNTS